MDKTVFVTLTDTSYFSKAKRTIEEIREKGKWEGDIVLLTVDFFLSEPLDNVICRPIQHIDHKHLFNTWQKNPIRKMEDNRHYGKVYQWDKLQVFDSFFTKWDRVVFLDAGMRICDSVHHLLHLDYKNSFLAPDDSDPYDNGNRLRCQFDWDANPPVTEKLLNTFKIDLLQQKYFLNCIFLFDTKLISELNPKEKMLKWMNEYPISLCNEMGIMNLFFTTKQMIWKPFPQRVSDNSKYLFGWSELNYKEKPDWKQFCFLKYPSSI
jgi:hypothetical protein